MPPQFVHLHLHTSYSLLDGACRIESLMGSLQKNGMTAAAITDHGVMYGIVEFYKAARDKGVKPILGCEVYEATGSRHDRKAEGAAQTTANHLVLLAADDTGYANLIQLVTAAHLEGFYYKPRIDREILSRHSKGLIGLSACLKGRVAEHLLSGDEAGAFQAAGAYGEIFGAGNFFLELQEHHIPEQRKVNAGMVALARKTRLPLVATNDVHYLEQKHAVAHEVLLCLQTGTLMSDPKHMRYASNEFYLRSAAEMAALFGDYPEALGNTVEIAHRCNVELNFKGSHFPGLKPAAGQTQKSYLVELCKQGLQKRYGLADPDRPRDDREKAIVERMNYEIGVIEKTGYLGYFLVVWDFVRFAREKRIPVGPGRGSGAGSLVSYCLGITGIDPLRYNLVFERFLNPERVSPPDFDIDFCQFRRGEVIEYVKEKYGRDNVAQIITFGSLGAKTVIRDIGRVLQVPLPDCDKLAKMVPEDPDMTLETALKLNPEFKRASETDPSARKILEHAFVLEGLYRNAGVHAAGVVIGDGPLVNLVPLARDKSGEVVTQFSKDHVEALGLLKADFLGLKTLTVIDETIKLIKQTKGAEIDIENIPIDDTLTYELLQRGDTIGVFQLESRGMRDLVRRIGLDRIEDLIAMIALYRPGPMNMLEKYVESKTGRVKIAYDDPLLEPILAETYGVMLYQEQVQQAAHKLAGFSMGQGDILRRAMGKKNLEEMEKQRHNFIEGCRKTSRLPAAKAEKIFENIAKFAGYGFNKSHSAGYGVIAYQTAWLKAHYPEEFMAALLSSEIGHPDKLPVFMNEAKAMQLDILPPDINQSLARFRPLKGAIRYGLAGVKNIGEGAAESIVAEREQNGPYKSPIDFCVRLDSKIVNRKVLETLVRCGAFDQFGNHRAQMLNALDLLMNRAAAIQRDRQSGQGSLFGFEADNAGGERDESLPDCPPWHENELLAAEKELLGIYMSGHPLSQYEPLLCRYRLAKIDELLRLPNGTLTRVGGIVAKIEKKFTKNKDPMAIAQIEDVDGSFEAVVFPDAFREYQEILSEGTPIMICGKVANNEDLPKMIVSEVYALDQVPRYFAERLSLHLSASGVNDQVLEKIKAVIKAHPGPTPLQICLQFEKGQEVFIKAGSTLLVNPTEKLVQELERLNGENTVFVAVATKPCRRATGKGRGNGFQKNGGGR